MPEKCRDFETIDFSSNIKNILLPLIFIEIFVYFEANKSDCYGIFIWSFFGDDLFGLIRDFRLIGGLKGVLGVRKKLLQKWSPNRKLKAINSPWIVCFERFGINIPYGRYSAGQWGWNGIVTIHYIHITLRIFHWFHRHLECDFFIFYYLIKYTR
jgi:hypothetical protein